MCQINCSRGCIECAPEEHNIDINILLNITKALYYRLCEWEQGYKLEEDTHACENFEHFMGWRKEDLDNAA